jgi:branched-chain amino acid aminotransferase
VVGLSDEQVFLNGDMVPLAEAVLPVDDRAALFGDSAFETVRAYDGQPFRLWRHLERLAESCRLLRIDLPLSSMEITAAVALILGENELDSRGDARVRVTVTGGLSHGPKGLEGRGRPSIIITARPYEPPSSEQYERGLSLAISGIKRNTSSPLSQMKTGNYMDSMFARQEALDRGHDDAVMLTTAGNLAEATSSNLFIVKDGEVLTPNMGCAFLPGITREALIEICLEEGVPCREIMEGPDTLMSANEVFLTNSMFEIMPACRVGTRSVPSCPGPVTRRLHATYRELVSREAPC